MSNIKFILPQNGTPEPEPEIVSAQFHIEPMPGTNQMLLVARINGERVTLGHIGIFGGKIGIARNSIAFKYAEYFNLDESGQIYYYDKRADGKMKAT